MRPSLSLTLAVTLLTSHITAQKIPLIRKTYRRHLSSPSWQTKRTIKSDLLFSDSAIIAPISIGTPAQHLYVLLDTSSSDLAVFSSQYISQYTPTTPASAPTLGIAYSSSSSSSYNSTSELFQNDYGSGPTASSFVAKTAKETVSIRGYELTNQPFGVIQTGNVSYGPEASGILGLAFQAISTGMRATPPIHQLFLDGALPAPLFSFALTRPSTQSELSTQSDVTEPGGIFTLGHIDEDQYQGKIGWSDLVSSGTQPLVPTKWLAPLDHITVNGVIVEGSQGIIANFDTGSSASRASQSTLASLFVAAKGALMSSSSGSYFLPCGGGIDPAMRISISMGGVSVDIEPMDMLYKTQAYTSGGKVYCESTLTTTTSQQYDIQIGDDMMRSLFVAFQYDPPQLGLAAQSTDLYNEAAAPSFAYLSNDAISIDSPVSPSVPSTPSQVDVQTVTSRAMAYAPVVTESGGTYTFQEGGQFVPTATEQDPPVVASSTPVPQGPVVTTSTTDSNGISSDSSDSSSASSISPMIALIIAISTAFFLLLQ